MKEVDLCKPAIQWLQSQHWDVYQEVQWCSFGTIIDIVAYRKPVVWMIEAKTSLSTSVIYQAIKHLPWAHMVSVLIPSGKREAGMAICEKLGIGVLVLDENGGVFQRVAPEFLRKNHKYAKKYIIPSLTEAHKTGEYGEAGNANGYRYTPYKSTVNNIRSFLRGKARGATIAEICQAIDHHYSNENAAKQCIAKAMNEWETGFDSRREGRQWFYSLTADKEKE